MNDMNKKILKLIQSDYSMRDIANSLGISEKQLFIKIKQIIKYGYNLEPKYCYDSNIFYKINTMPENTIPEFRLTISKNCNETKFIVISDTHFGNIDSDINLLKKVYDYASDNDIHIIFNCGDLIDGDYTSSKRNISSVNSQIEYLVKKHPYDKDIRNFIILGNHDYHSIKEYGLDISKNIANSRYDMIPIGYGKGIVKLKNNSLALIHKLTNSNKLILPDDCKLILSGHGHMMKTKAYDRFNICVPALSNQSPDANKEVVPGFVELKIDFEKGNFEFITAKHYIILNKPIQVSESRCKTKLLYK